MKQLTGVFKFNRINGSFVEIMKSVNGIIEFLQVPLTDFALTSFDRIMISERFFNNHKDFFRNIKSWNY